MLNYYGMGYRNHSVAPISWGDNPATSNGGWLGAGSKRHLLAVVPQSLALFVLLSTTIWPLHAQNRAAAKVEVKNYSIEQGLSNRNVTYFAKDKQGFVWIATLDGLNRFDGYSFLNYDTRPRNKHKIRTANVSALIPDRTGNMLICHNNPGKVSIDLLYPLIGRVTAFDFDTAAGFRGVYRTFFRAPDGTIYFHALQGGKVVVYQFDEKRLKFTQLYSAEHLGVDESCFVNFLKAADGTFWFAYNWEMKEVLVIHADATGRTIRSYRKKDFELGPGSSAGHIVLSETAKGEILFGLYTHGVYRMETSESGICKRYPLLPPQGYFLEKDSKGNLLAYRLKPEEPAKSCYLLTAKGQVYDYSWIFEHQVMITQVFSDDFTQGLFAGSGDGFNSYRLRPNWFKTYLDKDLGKAPYGVSMRGIAKLGQHKIVFASELEGLYELDLKTNLVTRPGDRLPQLAALNQLQYPRNVLTQGDSVVWVACLGRVCRYEPLSNRIVFYKTTQDEDPSAADEVWGIAFAKGGGGIWVVTRDGRLLHLDPASGQVALYKDKDGNPPQIAQPRFLLCGRDGTIWVGTTSTGLLRIDPEKGETRQYTANPNDPAGFDSNHITCVHEDAAGMLWVGTMEGGLHVFDPRRSRVTAIYSRENGLRNNSVVGILPDNKGNYWVSTFNGLAYFDTKLNTFRNFTTADGLSHNEFNRYSYFFDQDAGRFYFGGMNGVIAFDQNDPRQAENNAPLLISEMSVTRQDGEPLVQQEGIMDGATITLEPGSRLLQLRLALGTYLDPGDNQFSYKIEGLDKDWNYLGTNRVLRIDQLPTGSYTLRLRGADNRGNWSSQEIALRLIVQQFWYKRWWAYLLYAALIAGGGWYFYRFQLRRRIAEKETQRLQQLDAFKTRFFTNISHEFRTPLTVILGMVDALKKHFEKRAAPEHEQATELIRRNSRQVLNLVNQLLDLARLESGKLDLSPTNGDIATFLHYQLQSFQSYAETRRIALHFHSALPHLEMAFDHEKIQTICVNLLSNAIKFTPEGGRVGLTIDDLRFTIGAPEKSEIRPFQGDKKSETRNPKSEIEIRVSDTGIGIPAEALGRVFDRFYQVDGSLTRKGEGTGIGLALVQELVKLMGGTVSVDSQPGKGTTFRITLPYTPPLAHLPASTDIGAVGGIAPVSGEMPLLEQPSEDDQRPLLLIVEDNADVRFYIAECVRRDYRVVTAENGAAGIQKALELVPDIVISDVMMPEKDGFDLCETLKNDERTSHIPIVLLTARADFESRIAGLKRGADDYLAKPFEPVELQIRLENLVKLRRRLQERYAAMPFQAVASDDPALALEDAFLLKIRDVVAARLMETDFDMAQLERELGMSRSQVFRKVKALTGASPSVLIRNIRLQKAQELLRGSALTIAEIAYEVGFSTPAYFSTMFLETFGKTPSEWRQT